MQEYFKNILKLKFQKFEECLRLKSFEIWNRQRMMLRPFFLAQIQFLLSHKI